MYYATNNQGQPDKRFRKGQSFELDDITYPSAIWRENNSYLASIGLYPMIPASVDENHVNGLADNWDFVNDTFEERRNPVLRPIEVLKARRISELTQLKTTTSFSGMVILTKPVATDQEMQNMVNIIASALSAGEPYPAAGIPFYTLENERFRLSEAQFQTLTKEMAKHLLQCRNNFESHEDAINALNTQQEVVDYDITTGWPVNPEL